MKDKRKLQCGLGVWAALAVAVAAEPAANTFAGRWDLEVQRPNSQQAASWMEVSDQGGVPRVTYVGPVGDAAEATQVVIDNGELRFTMPKDPNEGKELDVDYRVRLQNGKLAGSLRATHGSTATFTGVRAPALAATKNVTWGKPIQLFDGKDLSGWHFSSSAHDNWSVKDGTFLTAGRGAELISDGKFGDFKLHLEFQSGPKANSGLYLRGRYEVQLETDSASEKPSHHTGGVYGFLAPQPEQPRKPGVWQSFDITLVGRTLTVAQNGITVIDHKEVPGITGGALDSREGDPGPIYLQGSEEGTTTFRNVLLIPAAQKG